MLSSSAQIAVLALALAPSLASAAIFPKDTLVKMLDATSFRKAMKANETSLVAFVAPWCGHCQRMAPEYSKAALGLHPLVPVYAVDCDANENKRLCAEQGVKGFPTVKLFPRGSSLGSMTYDSGERTASAFWYWATRRIPNTVAKFYQVEDIQPWVEKTSTKHRALLLTKEKKVPLLWKVLGNKYKDQLELGTHRDRKGKSSVALGLEAGEKNQAKVLVYPAGSTRFVRYEGINKLDSLSKFFDSVLDGTADFSALNEAAKAEEYAPTQEELDIQAKQEAQRIALMHGGFADIIDFEKALKDGTGAGYHDTHGYHGMMGSPPLAKKKTETETETETETKTETETETETETKTEEAPAAEAVPEQKKKAAVPPVGGKCDLAEEGPGAEPPMECDPPALETEGSQVVLEQKDAKKDAVPPIQRQCGVADEGADCNPPAHPKDEL